MYVLLGKKIEGGDFVVWRNDHMGMVALLVGIGGVMGNIVYYFQRSCWEYTYVAHVVHTHKVRV